MTHEDLKAHLPVALQLIDEVIDATLELVVFIDENFSHLDIRGRSKLYSLCEATVCSLDGAKKIAAEDELDVKAFLSAFKLPLPFSYMLFDALNAEFWLKPTEEGDLTWHDSRVGVLHRVVKVATSLVHMQKELKGEIDWDALGKEAEEEEKK